MHRLSKYVLLSSLIALLGGGCVFTSPVSTELTTKGCSPTALTILEPSPGSSVTSPIAVRVRIDNRNPDCRWTVFEAQAGSMKIEDAAGRELGRGILTSVGEWMTIEPVIYQGTIVVQSGVTGPVQLTITEEDPSGMGNSQTVAMQLELTE